MNQYGVHGSQSQQEQHNTYSTGSSATLYSRPHPSRDTGRNPISGESPKQQMTVDNRQDLPNWLQGANPPTSQSPGHAFAVQMPQQTFQGYSQEYSPELQRNQNHNYSQADLQRNQSHNYTQAILQQGEGQSYAQVSQYGYAPSPQQSQGYYSNGIRQSPNATPRRNHRSGEQDRTPAPGFVDVERHLQHAQFRITELEAELFREKQSRKELGAAVDQLVLDVDRGKRKLADSAQKIEQLEAENLSLRSQLNQTSVASSLGQPRQLRPAPVSQGRPTSSDLPPRLPTPTSLHDIEGAVEAGWRNYDVGGGKIVFVNDKTYEEAPTLAKVVKYMNEMRERESRGIQATGTIGDTVGGDLTPCPHCGRKFGPNSIKRHVEVCGSRATSHTFAL